jgi:hypothetical protein
MSIGPLRYVGHSDFHDGSILAVSRTENKMHVTIEGSSGKRYVVEFDGVSSVESESPEGMMLYALSEAETEAESLLRYEFINWHAMKLMNRVQNPICGSWPATSLSQIPISRTCLKGSFQVGILLVAGSVHASAR